MAARRRRPTTQRSESPPPPIGHNSGNLQLSVRALDAPITKRSDTTRQVDDEVVTVSGIRAATEVVTTPYQVNTLAQIFERSNVLRQAVEVYMVNIVSYGYRAVPRFEGTEMDPTEVEILQSWINNANPDESLAGVARKYLYDYERYGFGFFEVIRDADDRPSILRYAKANRTRILRKGARLITVTTDILRGNRRSTIKERKRFRRYVQEQPNSKEVVYFKEFGDPRVMDWRDGEFQGVNGKGRVRPSNRATELIHGKQLSDEAYGVPRWISQLPNVLGSRESEEVNLRFFEDNTVPPMMLLVSGGQITGKSFKQLEEAMSSGGLGKDRQHQIMLVEAVPETAGLDDKGHVDLKVEKLTNDRQNDALFSGYDKDNQAKIQSSYRLPNTLMGKSQDVNFATANVSQFIAETQVFLPERQIHDELLNMKLINNPMGLNLQTVKLEAKGPQITNPAEVVKTLTAANVMGALTPRASIDALNEALQLSLPQYPERPSDFDDDSDERHESGYEAWMDKPIAIALRELQAAGRIREEQDVDGNGSETRKTEEDGDITFTNPENGEE